MQRSFQIYNFNSPNTITAIKADEPKALLNFGKVNTAFKSFENNLGNRTGGSLFAMDRKVRQGKIVQLNNCVTPV